MGAAAAQHLGLPPVIDLDTLDPLREALLEHLEQGPLTVDAGGVERVATNALFMLLSAAETARRLGVGFRLAGPSEALGAAIARLGLGDAFAPLLGDGEEAA